MTPVIFIIGKSGAGKDFYCKRVCSHGNAVPVIQYTTRPIRADEVNGKDINCVSVDEFNRLTIEKKIFECRLYNVNVGGVPDTWYYGTPAFTELEGDKFYVLASTVDIVKAATNAYRDNLDIEVIYIDTDNDIREYRASKLRKSFDKTEWDRRVAADAIDYSEERLKMIEECTGKKIHRFNNNKEEQSEKFNEFFEEILAKLKENKERRNSICPN